MPHTFFPDTVEFLSVVTETHRSHTKIQIFAYFNSSLISGKKKKKRKRIPNKTATKRHK